MNQKTIFSCYEGNSANDNSSKRKVKVNVTQLPIKTNLERPQCPICNNNLWFDDALNNMHIDRCLSTTTNNKRQKTSFSEQFTTTLGNKEATKDSVDPKSKRDPSNTVTNDSSVRDSSPMNQPADLTVGMCSSTAVQESSPTPMPVANWGKKHNGGESSFPLFHGSIYEVEEVPGLWIIEDFLTEEEEIELVKKLDSDSSTPWKHSSFNGHCDSKVFGVRTQFGLPNEPRLVRQNDISKGEYDIPYYLHPLMERLQHLIHSRKDLPVDTRNFVPNECNANSYLKIKGHYLKPHFDDRALSGPLLVNLSLLGRCRMTYTKPQTSVSVSVHLPRRCIQLISGAARWDFMHSIKLEDVFDARRVSITWRHSGSKATGIQPLPKIQSASAHFFQLRERQGSKHEIIVFDDDT